MVEIFLLIEAFQWFLMLFSARPSRIWAISVHLLPWFFCRMYRIRSSSRLHFVFLIFGSRWLCHRSLHCLLIFPGRFSAIWLQLQAPFSLTSCIRRASCSELQDALFLTRAGSITKLHRSRHCLFVRPSTHSAILFQSRPYFYTAAVNLSSSSWVHGPLRPLTNSGLSALYHLSKH